MQGHKSRDLNTNYRECFRTCFNEKQLNRCHSKPFDFTEHVVLSSEPIQEVTFS